MATPPEHLRRESADRPLWMTSPLHERVAGESAFVRPVRIADCTLRDGEQQAGVVFSADDKLAIARRLDSLGVYEIEAGTPAVSEQDRIALQAIAGAGLKARISALARARTDDVDLVKSCGAWGVRLSLPIGYVQRAHKFELSDEAYLKLAIEITEYAKAQGLEVIFSPYDTTRCDLDFLKRVLEELTRRQTVDRIRIVDTVGCATPEIIKFLIGEVRATTPVPLEIHCHDDFGLAVANTVAAAQAGAQYLSVTVNGIGERSGNAALEEVAVALLVLHGVDTGIETTQLTDMSRLVEESSRVALQRHKPVVGSNSFAHESGTVVAGVLEEPFTGEAYAPELVGQRREIVLGKMSGAASIRARLDELGLDGLQDRVGELLRLVKEEAIATGAPVGEERFRALSGMLEKGRARE